MYQEGRKTILEDMGNKNKVEVQLNSMVIVFNYILQSSCHHLNGVKTFTLPSLHMNKHMHHVN